MDQDSEDCVFPVLATPGRAQDDEDAVSKPHPTANLPRLKGPPDEHACFPARRPGSS
jgi:hypothetical protein